jgi:hypothetical protein
MKHRAIGERERLQFAREVEILPWVDHPTLLALRGFVPLDKTASDSPGIVTDFMAHRSYEGLLAAERSGNSPAELQSSRIGENDRNEVPDKSLFHAAGVLEGEPSDWSADV